VKRNRLQVLCVAMELLLMQVFVDDMGKSMTDGMGKKPFKKQFAKWIKRQRCETFNVVTDLVDAMRSVLLFHEATRTGNVELLLGARLQLLEYLLASKHVRYAEVVTRELHLLLKLKMHRPEVFEVYQRFASTHGGESGSGINGMSGDERTEVDGVRPTRDNAGDMRSTASVQRAAVLCRCFNGSAGSLERRVSMLLDLGVSTSYREREGSTKEMARDVVMAMAVLRAGGIDRLLHANADCNKFKCTARKGKGKAAPEQHLIGLGDVPLQWVRGTSLSDECAAAIGAWFKAIETNSVPSKDDINCISRLRAK
jgi:hypothetical protein